MDVSPQFGSNSRYCGEADKDKRQRYERERVVQQVGNKSAEYDGVLVAQQTLVVAGSLEAPEGLQDANTDSDCVDS